MQAAITPADIRWPISIGYSDLPETETFTVEAIDRLSFYETVMVYCGRPPWNPELRKRDATHEMVSEWLTTFNEDATTAVLRDLLGLIHRGELPAATILDDGGKIDLLKSTVVAEVALLALAATRGERAWYHIDPVLRPSSPARNHAGRPSMDAAASKAFDAVFEEKGESCLTYSNKALARLAEAKTGEVRFSKLEKTASRWKKGKLSRAQTAHK
jgi:hypothetical protein